MATTPDSSWLQPGSTYRHDMGWVSDRLIAEFDGLLPATTVVRHVARAREQLLVLGLRAGLPYATEAMARGRLRDLSSHQPVAARSLLPQRRAGSLSALPGGDDSPRGYRPIEKDRGEV